MRGADVESHRRYSDGGIDVGFFCSFSWDKAASGDEEESFFYLLGFENTGFLEVLDELYIIIGRRRRGNRGITHLSCFEET